MGYYGNQPATGENNSFRVLDDLSSYTLTFDGSSAGVVSTANSTLTVLNHRFVTGQRVTYNDGGGTAIGGLSDGVYYVTKVSKDTIKLADSYANAVASSNITFSGLGVGSSHTLNVAFDGVNTRFTATHGGGNKSRVTRPAQLQISINGVIQQPVDSTTPSAGFGVDSDSVIVFSTAPSSSDVFWGYVVANNATSFDMADNTVDTFTGDGSTLEFTLSKAVANNQNALVTLDGVVQYPSDATTTRAYTITSNIITFASAPALDVDIQVRHIGFAGATSSAVTGFYGRTGNAALQATDDVTVGTLSATSISGTAVTFTTGTFSGNVSIGGTLTYEDVTNIDSVGVITARSGIHVTGGSVGIGTDNPQHNLHLYNNGDATLFIQADADNVDETHNPKISMSQDGLTSSIFDLGINGTAGDAFTGALANTAYLYSVSNLTSNGIQFATNGAARMYLNNNGRLGIGSQAPADPLDIANDDPAIRLTDIDGEVYHRVRSSSQDLLIECDDGAAGSKPNLRFQVGNDEKFRVTGVGGSFGIGTNDPQTRFHVNATIDDNDAPQWAFHLTQDDPLNSFNQVGGSGIGILFKPATNSDPAIGAGIAAEKPGTSDDNTTTDLVFYTSQNDETLDEAVRIDSNGVVTIPGHPIMEVYTVTSASRSVTGNTNSTLIPFNAANTYDPGGDMNITTGVYTVPADGRYLLHYGTDGKTAANANAGSIYYALNGTENLGQCLYYGDAYSGNFRQLVLNLSASDTIHFHIRGNNNQAYTINNAYYGIRLVG